MDSKLIELLVCPESKGKLVFDRNKNELICKLSGLAYPVRDGIPILLVEEARKLGTEQ